MGFWDIELGNRRGTGCGCFVWGGAALIIGATFVLRHLHQIKVGTALFAAALVAAVLVREGLRRLPPREKPPAERAAGAMPTPLADLAAGVATTAGLVVDEAARQAPLGGRACVFYRFLVTPLHSPDKLLFEGRSADVLTLGDGAGAKLTVRLDGATWRLRHEDHESSSPDDDVARFLSERGVAAAGPVRVRVESIGPHELVFVRGLVRKIGDGEPSEYRTSERARWEMTSTPEHPLEIDLEPIA